MPEDSTEDIPIWQPEKEYPCPPPLPRPKKQPKIRAITSKEYRELSALQPILKTRAHEEEPPPLLPTDLPAIKKLLAARASDSEGAVTSKAKASGGAVGGGGEESGEEDAELANLLEETLMAEEDVAEEIEEVEEEQLVAAAAAGRKSLPSPRKSLSKAAAAAEAEPQSKRTYKPPTRRVIRQQKNDEQATANLPVPVAENDNWIEEAQERRQQEGPEVDLELNLEGIEAISGSISRRITAAALRAINFSSWDEFVDSQLKAAAATAASGSRRKARPKAASAVTLSDVLNKTSGLYHGGFARAYKAAKDALQKQEAAKRKAEALEEHSALVGRWSSLTAGEHTWYLKHQGRNLTASDAQRFAALTAQVEAERREYWNAVHAAAAAQQHRYQYLTERQKAQLQSDLTLRRQRALDLPKQWSFREFISLSVSSRKSAAVPLAQEKELVRQGEAPVLSPLTIGTVLPGNKIYLPVMLGEGAGPRPGSTGDVYRKACTADIWEDPVLGCALENMEGEVVVCASAGALLCMLRSALLQHSTAWEVPVTIAIEGHQRRIYLEKPLLAAKESLRDKQRRLQKYAVLTEAFKRHQGSVSTRRGGGANASPRETLYWQTCLTSGVPLVVRTHARVVLDSSTPFEEEKQQEVEPGEAPALATEKISAVLVASPDYLPEPDIEEDTSEELLTWWLKLLLTPGAESAVIATVRVHSSSVAQWRVMGQRELQQAFLGDDADGEEGNSIDLQYAVATLDAVVEVLKSLDPGKYLLKHDTDEKKVELLQEEESNIGAVPGMPSYDLHAAQSTAGEADRSADLFIPPKWRPYREDVAQIPYTFPPKTGVRERGGVKKRQRKMPWQGDMDQVNHTAKIDRNDYRLSLEEALE